MARIMSISIDVTKIDKTKILSLDKNGQPFKNNAKYLNLDVVLNDEVNEYGQDCSIRISQSKEEREAKVKAVYLGNGKTVWTSDTTQTKPLDAVPMPKAEADDLDLPF